MSRMRNIAGVLNGADAENERLPSSYLSFWSRNESYIELKDGRHSLH